jgi:hypothetical protein
LIAADLLAEMCAPCPPMTSPALDSRLSVACDSSTKQVPQRIVRKAGTNKYHDYNRRASALRAATHYRGICAVGRHADRQRKHIATPCPYKLQSPGQIPSVEPSETFQTGKYTSVASATSGQRSFDIGGLSTSFRQRYPGIENNTFPVRRPDEQ